MDLKRHWKLKVDTPYGAVWFFADGDLLSDAARDSIRKKIKSQGLDEDCARLLETTHLVYAVYRTVDYESGDVESIHATKEGAEKAIQREIERDGGSWSLTQWGEYERGDKTLSVTEYEVEA